MKFTVSQAALAKALLVVAKGMATNSTLPYLSGIYLKATEGTLELQTANLTISIRHQIAANVEEDGVTVVSGKILTGIVKTLPDAAVTFDMREGSRVMEISCSKSHFRLNTLDATDFPDFPVLELNRTIELPSALLSDMVDKVYKVTSRDNSRPILQGVLLSVEDNTIRLVATDSYRLAVCDSHVETSSSNEAFVTIVPGNTFHDVLALPSMTEQVMVGTTENQVVFSFGNTTYVSRRIEGNFPDYRRLLPAGCTTSVQLGSEEFGAALRRVSVIASSNPSVRLDADVDGKLVRLSASSPDQGESTEMLDAVVDGQTMAIALNYHYVLDCVAAVGSAANLTLELQGSMQPAIFKSYGTINYLYLLMPVRM